MGFAMFDLHVPCTKTSSALLCMAEDPASESMKLLHVLTADAA